MPSNSPQVGRKDSTMGTKKKMSINSHIRWVLGQTIQRKMKNKLHFGLKTIEMCKIYALMEEPEMECAKTIKTSNLGPS
jgi:hypothetical protein